MRAGGGRLRPGPVSLESLESVRFGLIAVIAGGCGRFGRSAHGFARRRFGPRDFRDRLCAENLRYADGGPLGRDGAGDVPTVPHREAIREEKDEGGDEGKHGAVVKYRPRELPWSGAPGRKD